MKMWRYGGMEIQRCGSMARCEYVQVSGYGVWRYAIIGVCKYGSMEVWTYGHMEVSRY